MAAFLLDDEPTSERVGGGFNSDKNRLDVNSPSQAIEPFGTTQASTGLEPSIQTDVSLPSLKDVSRKSESSFKNKGGSAEDIAKLKGVATGAAFGTQIGGVQTGQEEVVSVDTAIQVLSGAGMGFAVGGPMGALAGGLAAGVGAFLSTRANKKRNKEVRAKEERYQRIAKQQLAREERFRKEERFDRLEGLNYNRRDDKMQKQNAAYKDFTGQIMNLINTDANLKRRFTKEGF